MNLEEAARQLTMAVHDAKVAFDCMGLGELERAHEHAITARAAIDAAEMGLRQALTDLTEDEADLQGERAVRALADD